jgi:hypothetical protein
MVSRCCRPVIVVSGDALDHCDAVLVVNDVQVMDPYVDHESFDGPVLRVRSPCQGRYWCLATPKRTDRLRSFDDIRLQGATETAVAVRFGTPAGS